jgi:tetratricopeptide (TPR) repeat protein
MRCILIGFSQKDCDETIAHLTEAVLLPIYLPQDVVHTFFHLASALLFRYIWYRQPDDIKSSVKYFRFLRINFHRLEAFKIPHGLFTPRLLEALARNLALGSGDVIQDIEEMLAVIPEVLALDVSIYHPVEKATLQVAIDAFTDAVVKTDVLRQKDTQQLVERVIQMLREATVLLPDSHNASYALFVCLALRFDVTHVINDYEEAMAIADKIVAAHSPGDRLTQRQIKAVALISTLLLFRLDSYSRPDYLEDAIHRFRTLLRLPSLPDRLRTVLTGGLNICAQRRFKYFGVTGNSGRAADDTSNVAYTSLVQIALDFFRHDPAFKAEEKQRDLVYNQLKIFQADATTDVEAIVEHSRTLRPLPQSRDQKSIMYALQFANILFYAHYRTKRLDYLNEAITAYRDIRKMSTSKATHFRAGYHLLLSLMARFNLLLVPEDYFPEVMQLCLELANDESEEVFTRFKISSMWARTARAFAHSSTSAAYETAMSLLQEALVFSPTLQTQHFYLARAPGIYEMLPSEYASYQIHKGQFNQAIETLERGRSLLWSEMRGLRTSTDQLCAADRALGDKFTDINRRLESVTMSIAQSESEEIGDGLADSGTGAGRHEGSIGDLVATQRRLLEERNLLISRIQSLPGFENFLRPPSFDVLSSAAAHGPIIIINQSPFRSCLILLLKDSPPSIISTPFNFHDRVNQLKDDLLYVRKEEGLDSEDYDLTLAYVLADLYELVGKPVIERLRQLKVREKSRVWWCPTGAFCFLPLHAMGPIPSDDGKELYFSDLYITSYTPTLSALIESRKPRSLSETFDKPSLLLVAQPDTLPGAWGEVEVIQTTETAVTTLVSAMATPKTVVERLRDHQFVHFVCHGLLETGKPFDASFELHGDNLTLLEIVRSQLPAAEFAFLSACHTAELTEDSVADEGLHLAAAMQYCGFRSVVGTMWAMADTDGADLSKHFYQSIFSESTSRKRVPYYERSARALHLAVKRLRRKRGITLERWVNFVHYGA